MIKKSPRTAWNVDWLQVSAVVLVVAMSASLMGLVSYNQSQATSIYNLKVAPTVQVELADSQPIQIIQSEHQWLARFKITTESSEPVVVSGVTFSPRGTLESQIIQLLTRYPLVLTSNGSELGRGQTWLYSDRITQTVKFNQLTSLDVLHPLIVDVATDLNNQTEETFGVTLVDVVAVDPISLHGAPIEGRLFEVQERF